MAKQSEFDNTFLEGVRDKHCCVLSVDVWISQPVVEFVSSLKPVGFPGGSEGKASACNVGDPGSIPESGRSPGEGNDNPLQYSCLENSMDGRAW